MKNLNLVYKINATNHTIKVFFFQNMFKSMIIFDMDRLYQYKKTHVFTK